MKTRAEMLAWKRQLLIAESNAQRAELALQVQPIAYTLSSIQVGMNILGRVRKHPGWIAALTFGLLAIRPHRLSAFMRLGTASLRVLRHMLPLLQAAPPEAPALENHATLPDAERIATSDLKLGHLLRSIQRPNSAID